MRKRVWILNHYAGESFADNGWRHYWFAKYLKRDGYEPVIFCSNAQHNGEAPFFFPMNDLWEEKEQEIIDVPYIFVKSRSYAGNGKDRVLNMADFYRNVQKAAKAYAKRSGAPDVIIASSVHPLTLIAGEKLAKKFGVPCICEIRDLWPEALVEYGKLNRDSLLVKALYAGEKWIYKKADALIFTMEGGRDYIAQQGWNTQIDKNKIFHINNGVDIEQFDENKTKYVWPDADLDSNNLYKIVYTGSINLINHLELIVDVAKIIQKQKNIKILVWGGGNELQDLQAKVKEAKLTNIVFKGTVEKKYIPGILSRADINLMHCWEMSDAVAKYGPSNNKLFEYLAAGKPIFSTVIPGYSILKRYQCGVETEEPTADAIAAGLLELINMPEEDKELLSVNARKTAYKYDFSELTEDLTGVIQYAEERKTIS